MCDTEGPREVPKETVMGALELKSRQRGTGGDRGAPRSFIEELGEVVQTAAVPSDA